MRRAAVGVHVQVELVDGLQVGDLEEQRPAVGQDIQCGELREAEAQLAQL